MNLIKSFPPWMVKISHSLIHMLHVSMDKKLNYSHVYLGHQMQYL